MKTLRKYLIPVRMTKLASSFNKAAIDSGWTEEGWRAWKNGNPPIPTLVAELQRAGAAPSARVYELEAVSHAEAYRKLCAMVRPSDPRPIMSKKYIGVFARCG